MNLMVDDGGDGGGLWLCCSMILMVVFNDYSLACVSEGMEMDEIRSSTDDVVSLRIMRRTDG